MLGELAPGIVNAPTDYEIGRGFTPVAFATIPVEAAWPNSSVLASGFNVTLHCRARVVWI